MVDKHTLDDNLRKEGSEVESRAVTKQRGFQRRCMTWSRAWRERKGRQNPCFILKNYVCLSLPGNFLSVFFLLRWETKMTGRGMVHFRT